MAFKSDAVAEDGAAVYAVTRAVIATADIHVGNHLWFPRRATED